MNNKNTVLAASLAAVALLAGCAPRAPEATVQSMAAPMNDYLAQRGDLCLSKESWPIDVPAPEAGERSRNGVQMPVLAHVGLVTETPVKLEAQGERPATDAMRYVLTDEGKKYIRTRVALDGERKAAHADFCAAHLTLDKVVSVELHDDDKHRSVASVSYTYKVEAAPWTGDADVQKAFPMVDRVVRGAGTLQLKQSFRFVEGGWVAEGV